TTMTSATKGRLTSVRRSVVTGRMSSTGVRYQAPKPKLSGPPVIISPPPLSTKVRNRSSCPGVKRAAEPLTTTALYASGAVMSATPPSTTLNPWALRMRASTGSSTTSSGGLVRTLTSPCSLVEPATSAPVSRVTLTARLAASGAVNLKGTAVVPGCTSIESGSRSERPAVALSVTDVGTSDSTTATASIS